MADVAFVVSDDVQNEGIGRELLSYLTLLATKQGLLGFTAEVLVNNIPMQHLFETAGFDITKRNVEGLYELKMMFKE
jgi:ribosomal protein S18 acetylase RimI-like enzyme